MAVPAWVMAAGAQVLGGLVSGLTRRAEKITGPKNTPAFGNQIFPQDLAQAQAGAQYATQQQQSQGQSTTYQNTAMRFQDDQQWNRLTAQSRERSLDRALQLQLQQNQLAFDGQFQGQKPFYWPDHSRIDNLPASELRIPPSQWDLHKMLGEEGMR